MSTITIMMHCSQWILRLNWLSPKMILILNISWCFHIFNCNTNFQRVKFTWLSFSFTYRVLIWVCIIAEVFIICLKIHVWHFILGTNIIYIKSDAATINIHLFLNNLSQYLLVLNLWLWRWRLHLCLTHRRSLFTIQKRSLSVSINTL